VTHRRALTAHGDALLAVALGALFLLEILTESGFGSRRGLSLALAGLFVVALAWRRPLPLLGLIAGVALIEVSNLAVPALANTATFLLAYAVAIYSCGRHTQGRWAVAAGVIVLAAIPLAAIEPGQPFSLSDAGFIVIFSLGPFAAGRLVRVRNARERGLVAERDTRARAAVAEERGRIARELHDVVAHAISVMVLQARGGRRMLDEDPAQTRDALGVIERSGEQALSEMRRLLGLLRESDDGLALAPQPGLARLGELVAGVTASGLPLEVTVEGEPFGLPPGVDVSAYRIVQEALTNALKHAGPARGQVIVRYAPDAVELEVRDDGPGTGNGGGSGHGLAGIRERVAVYGGDFESGRRPEGGYAVRARLPLEPAQ
jgi:signal transduction histidine kinase